jgi:membrane protein
MSGEGGVRRLRDISAADWRGAALRLSRGPKRHQTSVVAGGVAFFAFVSLFPALAALVSTFGLLAGRANVATQVNALAGELPEQARAVLQTELANLLARSTGRLSLEMAVGLVGALWAASKATKALITALTMASEQEETRGHLRMKLVAFGFTGGAMAVGLVALAAMAALPAVLGHLGLSRLGERLVAWLRWPALAAVVLGWLVAAYRFGPPRPPTAWRWISPGALLAAAMWLVGSALFSWFVSRFGSYEQLEGTLGAILIFLSWFLLSAYVVIFGAELNAELGRPTAARLA